MVKQPKKIMSTREVAAATGQSTSTVAKHARQGAPHRVEGKRGARKWSLHEYEAWRKTNNLSGQRGRPADANTPDIEAARLRKEIALGERYALQADRLRASTIDREDHLAVVAMLTSATTKRIRQLPKDIAARLVGLEGAEIQTALEAEVVRICDDLSNPNLYHPRTET